MKAHSKSSLFLIALLTISLIAPAIPHVKGAEGDYLGSWDISGQPTGNAFGITTDGEYIWTTDYHSDEVYKYFMNGTYTGEHWDTSGQMTIGMAITTNGENIWVGGRTNKEVYKYFMNGTYTGEHWDTSAHGSLLYSMTTDDSNIWTVDPGTDEVYKYTMAGVFVDSWDTSGQGTFAQGITTDGNVIWTSDYILDEVFKYFMNGTYTTEHWDTSAHGDFPYDLATNGTIIWIVDYTDDEVYFYEGPPPPSIPPPSVPDLLFGAGFNSSSPYVELQWNHSLVNVQFFEVQNSSDAVTWAYLGQSTTANYTDSQVVNGTERYYRVRACNQTDAVWYNSSWTLENFETVYFIPGIEGVGPTVYVDVNVTGTWIDYNFTSIITKIGNNTGGNTLNNTYWKEPGMFYSYNVTEVSGAPGLNVEFNITGLPDNLICLSLRNFLAYKGNTGHTFEVQAYNYTSSSWIFVADIPDVCCQWVNGTLGCLPGDFIQGGLFMGRYYHYSPGNTNHEFSLNYGKLRAYAQYEEECPPGDGVSVPVDDYSIIFLAMGLIFCLAIYFLYARNK